MKNLLISVTGDQLKDIMDGAPVGERILPLDDYSVLSIRIERVFVGALVGKIATKQTLEKVCEIKK